MHRPAVLWLHGERTQCGCLGVGILIHFLQSERVHAEHVGISGHGRVPVRQDPRHAIAQVLRVAAIEVHDVPDLQRECVVRIARQHTIERRTGRVPATVDQQRSRVNQPSLTVVGGPLVRASRRKCVTRHRRELPLGERVQDERLEEVPGNKGRRRAQRLVDGRDRVADIALELLQRALVARGREGIHSGHGDAARVFDHGEFPPFRLRSCVGGKVRYGDGDRQSHFGNKPDELAMNRPSDLDDVAVLALPEALRR